MLECDWSSAVTLFVIVVCSSIMIGIPAYFSHKERKMKEANKVSSNILYNNSEWGPEVSEDGDQKRS